MDSPTTLWTVCSSDVAVGLDTEGWTLAEPKSSCDDLRSFTVKVMFEVPFTAPPVVQLGITGFDMDQRDSSRLSLKVTSVTAEGFEATIATWEFSRVYGVEFNWLAIGA